MTKEIRADLCVIGGGSGGLSVAAGAAQMGARVVLFERHKMGGDCLNYGCVPSKAILAAGKAAHHMRHAGKFGITPIADPAVDFKAVHDHIHGVIGGIAPHDSVERFSGLGVNVITEGGSFDGPNIVISDSTRVVARRIVVSVGSSPFVPPIPGIQDTPHVTNETVFDQTVRPDHLLVIGGGPIGCELAQAHRMLGCKVTLIEMFSIMPNDDPEAVEVVRARLAGDGIELIEGAKVTAVGKEGDGVFVAYEKDGQQLKAPGTHLLVAAGRRPNLGGLNLEKAGIKYSPKGIEVDAGLVTSNRKVFAIGDCAGSYQFTHVAGYHSGIVIRKALFRLPAKVNYKAVPWVTYTEPELAHVGMREDQAREGGVLVTVLRFPYAENDRAQAERETDGFVKVITGKKGSILGATIVGSRAGELIQIWCLAISAGLKIGSMAGYIAPYPTLGELNKRVAGSYYTPKLFSETTRRVVRFLRMLG